MLCKNCRQEIPDDSKFCTFCGTVQDVPEPQAPPPAQPFVDYNAQPATDAPAAPAPAYGVTPAAPTAPDFAAAPTAPGAQPVAPAPDYAPAPAPAVPTPAPAYGEAPPAPDFAAAPTAPAAQAQPIPEYAPQPAPAQPEYAPQQGQQSYDGYQGAPQQQQPPQPQQYQQQPPPPQPQPQQYQQQPPQQQPQQSYAPAPAYPPAAPPKKKKTGLIIGIVAAAAVVLVGIGVFVMLNVFGGGGSAKGWTGGVASSTVPAGYAAIVDNEFLAIGVGEITPYHETNGTTTLQVELYINNRSDYPIYLVFRENKFDGRSAPYEDVYSGVLRTEPHSVDNGVVFIEFLHSPQELNNWTGTLYVVDDDTYYDANPVILDQYNFNLTYNW